MQKANREIRKRFQNLFLNTRGSMIFHFPDQGEFGYGIVHNGVRQGGFTRALLTSLKHPQTCWEKLAESIHVTLNRKPFPMRHFYLHSSSLQKVS